jgi:hypothetical protein
MTHRAFRCGAAATLISLLPASLAWSAEEVTGRYIANGSEAALTYAVVVPHAPWQGVKAYTLVLSSRDPAGVKQPDFDAMLGKMGDSLMVGVTAKGEVFSTQVCHQALKKHCFSTSGTLAVDHFKIEGQQLSGHFFTRKKEDFFDESWQADLTVNAQLP